MPGPVSDSDRTAEEIDALRRRLLNVVGHELRTPMAALAGLARQMSSASEEQIRAELAPAIERLATRTERLVDDLLLATGITTALPVESPEPIDLVTVTEEAWSSLGSLTTGRGLQLEGDGAVALVAPTTARRILAHLLRNAATYGRGEVEVHVTRRESTARTRIVNRGPVPTSEEQRLVFEPFYRGEHAVTAGPGLGLGLTVARTLARHAGGDVDFTPADTDRVEVTLELPAVA